MQRLKLYRLRAQVKLAITDMSVTRGIGTQPPDSLPDPRCPELGWRHYGKSGPPMPQKVDWEALRIKHCVPESGIELISGESFILEVGFERLHGVDFRKGCYVGQEVTARMKHKTTLRKELRTVLIEGSAPVGTTITAEGRNVGTLFSQVGRSGTCIVAAEPHFGSTHESRRRQNHSHLNQLSLHRRVPTRRKTEIHRCQRPPIRNFPCDRDFQPILRPPQEAR